jgi:hypothetical protein
MTASRPAMALPEMTVCSVGVGEDMFDAPPVEIKQK